ncbi:unnamed protein product, partial [Nesidiocoris tenuis]
MSSPVRRFPSLAAESAPASRPGASDLMPLVPQTILSSDQAIPTRSVTIHSSDISSSPYYGT